MLAFKKKTLKGGRHSVTHWAMGTLALAALTAIYETEYSSRWKRDPWRNVCRTTTSHLFSAAKPAIRADTTWHFNISILAFNISFFLVHFWVNQVRYRRWKMFRKSLIQPIICYIRFRCIEVWLMEKVKHEQEKNIWMHIPFHTLGFAKVCLEVNFQLSMPASS